MKDRWILKNATGAVTINPVHTSPERCAICGQYFRKGEKVSIIMCPEEFVHLRVNRKMVHLDEWNAYGIDVHSDLDLAEKLLSHRQPRVKSLTADETARINAFVQAAMQLGYTREYRTSCGRKCKKPGTSITIEYNVYLDTIRISSRGKEGLFDGFYKRELIAQVFNKMHEILGDNQRDNYTAQASMTQVFDDVKKMMGDF